MTFGLIDVHDSTSLETDMRFKFDMIKGLGWFPLDISRSSNMIIR